MDEKADLYEQECAALKELIDKHGCPDVSRRIGIVFQPINKDDHSTINSRTGILVQRREEPFDDCRIWFPFPYSTCCIPLKNATLPPYPAPCGETTLMLMEWLGCFELLWTQGYSLIKALGSEFRAASFTLALCAAVRVKSEEKHGA